MVLKKNTVSRSLSLAVEIGEILKPQHPIPISLLVMSRKDIKSVDIEKQLQPAHLGLEWSPEIWN
jgi:hypothetical protein